MVWIDILDGVLDAGDPPRAEIGIALRACDRANAEKCLPHEFAGTSSTSLANTWTTQATDYHYIPLDVPSGAKLNVAYKCYANLGASQSFGFNGQFRILLGSKISDVFEVAGASTNQSANHLFSVEVETGLRGTVASVSLQSQCSDNDPTDPVGDRSTTQIGGPDDLYRSQTSIRVP